MSPLTHAVAGMAISRRVRSPRLGRLGWPLGLALAFASHYLLDAIPHVDAVGPLRVFRFGGEFFPVFGLIGVGLAVYLYQRNRAAASIWILLSVWLVIAAFSGTTARSLTAIAMVAWLAYHTRRVDTPAYLLAAFLALWPDVLPPSLAGPRTIHDAVHYGESWAMSLMLRFQSPPFPPNNMARLQNPYYMAGLCLQMLVEGCIFLLAFYSFSRLALDQKSLEERAVSTREPDETGVPA